MKCPICEVDLVMSDRQGIEIDYCPKCRGIWLDRGELDKIIEKSASHGHQSTSPKYHTPRHDDDYDRDGYHRKKKESWLGEIFDF